MSSHSANQPSTANKGKRKRTVLTLSEKIDIVRRLESGVNRNVLMTEFGVGSSTLYDIKNQKGELLKFASESKVTKNTDQRRSMKRPKFEKLDDALYLWFSEKRSKGMPISGPMLIEKARDFHRRLNISEQCNFSDGWLTRFKIRHGIRKLDISGEKKSADEDAADEFVEKFASIVRQNNLTAEQIYNADETGLFWKCLPGSTLAGESESNPSGFKNKKDRITVLPCANAAGSHRLQLVVIGKFIRPRALKGVLHLPVDYRAQKNAWMDRTIFSDWFHHHFVPAVKNHLSTVPNLPNSKAVLLLDNCRAHPSTNDLISECGQIFTILLPPNSTSLIQPMDQGIIQNMKCHYRGGLLRKLVSKASVELFLSDYNIKNAIDNIAFAWRQVQPSTLQKAWRKLWPMVMFLNDSSDEDSFDGFQQVTKPHAQIMQLLVHAPSISTCNEQDIEQWVKVDDNVEVAHTVDDEEILSSILESTYKLPEEESEEEQDAVGGDEYSQVSWSDADKCMQTMIQFAERCPSYTAQEILQLYAVQNTFITKREARIKQRDIRSFFKNV
ncbi:hypothetical protein BsWGS_03368 [Bradybaena similaris]